MKRRLAFCLILAASLAAWILLFGWGSPDDSAHPGLNNAAFFAEEVAIGDGQFRAGDSSSPESRAADHTLLTHETPDQAGEETQSTESAASAEVSVASETAEEMRVWPVDPATMENLILNELASLPNVGIAAISSYACTSTACEFRLVPTSHIALLRGLNDGFRVVTDPPYSAVWSIRPVGAEVHLTLQTGRPELTPEQALERNQEAAAVTQRLAENALPPGSYDAEPVAFGTRSGATQLVEDVCSYDCPLDTRRIIYLAVPEGDHCSDYGGTEQTVMARSRTGVFSERVFCVPNILLESQAVP